MLNRKDYFNYSKERNFSNTKKQDYNCGGFAFKTFSWYIPMSGEDLEERLNNYDCYIYGLIDDLQAQVISLEEAISAQLDTCVEAIIEDFSDLIEEVVDDLTEDNLSTIDKNIVAFRVGFLYEDFYDDYEYDFHFKIKTKDKWYEKLGGRAISYTTPADWKELYNSKTVYFILK